MAENAKRKQRGKGRPFSKGTSGNPRGKRPGTRHRATQMAEQLLDGQAEELVHRVVDLALAGDIAALKICIDRLIPIRRERALSLTLPTVENAADLPRLTASILAAVAGGSLDVGQAAMLGSLIGTHAKVVETSELAERVRKLEGRET